MVGIFSLFCPFGTSIRVSWCGLIEPVRFRSCFVYIAIISCSSSEYRHRVIHNISERFFGVFSTRTNNLTLQSCKIPPFFLRGSRCRQFSLSAGRLVRATRSNVRISVVPSPFLSIRVLPPTRTLPDPALDPLYAVSGGIGKPSPRTY